MTVMRAASLFELGNQYDASGAFAQAAQAFGACAALAPDNPAVLVNLGNTLVKSGDMAGAAAAYRRYLALVPHDVDRWFALADALRLAEQLPEAVEAYVQCARRAPDFGPVYVNLAGTLRALGLLDQALTMAEAAVKLMPDNVNALTCIAGLHYDRGSFGVAVEWYGRALAVAPGHAGVLSSLGNALQAAGRLDAALVLHERAYAAAPDDAGFRYNRALALLSAGHFALGWAEHEWRLRRPVELARAIDRGTPWNGEPINGKTILLHAEQGFGDTIQFVRYAKSVSYDAEIVLEVPGPLVRLMESVAGIATVIAHGTPPPPYQLHCPLMSLPLHCASTTPSIPSDIPYLSARPAAIDRWKHWLAPRCSVGRPLIGLVWAGGVHHNDIDSHLIDRRRSLPVEALAPFATLDSVQFVSLQKDYSTPPALPMIDPMPAITDFADTAALIANLDLVIAVDTAVAHLAGALGKPVWLLSRFDGCWRWGDRQTTTPWYPRMRIFRQDQPFDWEGVVRRVASELHGWRSSLATTLDITSLPQQVPVNATT